MEIRDEKGNFIKKVPTINPKVPINRFEGQKKLAIYFNNHLMKSMDKRAFLRSLIIVITLALLLGKNFIWFTYFLLPLYVYLMIIRLIRFWVQRWLMFLLDFCYMGNYLLLYFIFIDNKNENIFYTLFPAASGIVSFAAIACDNQIDFYDTDLISSAFIHCAPMVSVWAIRWKHILYSPSVFEGKSFLSLGEIKFEFNSVLLRLTVFPFVFWFLWAMVYFVLNTVILRRFTYSDLYQSAVGDFYKVRTFEFLFGDHTKNTALKFLSMHFIFLIIVTPFAILNFYCFYFNTVYMIGIILFLGYNTQRKKKEEMVNKINEKKKKKEKENEIIKGK